MKTSTIKCILLALVLLIQGNFSVASISTCIYKERDALLDLKKSFIDESGCVSLSWSGENCCLWIGVTCSNITGHVVSIDLFRSRKNCKVFKFIGHARFDPTRLRGEIISTPSLATLEYLESLDLSHNLFSGNIPSSIGSLKNLRYLDLSGNNFTGAIPTSIGLLSKLEWLDASSNHISGPIPSSIGLLSKLGWLDASHNNISGPIPTSIGLLSELETLDLSVNSLSGTLSELHLANMARLKHLYLHSNNLRMDISHQWAPPFQLEYLYIESCIVGPKFPSWLQTQRNLTELDLSSTGISDIIPSWFESTLLSITYLDMSKNEIGGKVPEIQASNMEVLLYSNKFEFLFRRFPPHVRLLDLSNNLLSGHFPPKYDGPPVMDPSKDFIFSNNNLTGPVPEYLCRFNFSIIDLSSNQLSGELSSCFGNIETLLVLDLSNNSLHGLIPSDFGSGSNSLLSLHLSNNKFHGELPSSFQNFRYLHTLDLSNNAFTGFLPQWLTMINRIKVVNLQSNNFYGDIPETFCKLKDIQLLHIGQNNLTGTIPPCFVHFTGMTTEESQDDTYFVLEYRDHLEVYFEGLNLRYSSSLPFLISMDLSGNNIVGNIPPELMKLLELKNLNLSGNRLEGKIPEKIGNLKQLESLDLSRNRLSGAIPSSLSGLSFISHLNLSFNNLSGRIPTGNQLQTFEDPSIYMGNNQLCGKPLKRKCPGDVTESSGDGRVHSPQVEDDDSDRLWFYAGIGPGFFVGFLGFCSVMHFCKSWRHAFFMFFENGYNWLFVQIAVTASLLRKKFHKRQTVA